MLGHAAARRLDVYSSSSSPVLPLYLDMISFSTLGGTWLGLGLRVGEGEGGGEDEARVRVRVRVRIRDVGRHRLVVLELH